jgi:hypothetical protein
MENENQPIIMQPLPKKKFSIKFNLPKLRKSIISKLSKRQKVFCLLGIVIVVGAIGFGVYEFVSRGNSKNPVVAKVGSEKLYLSDYYTMSGDVKVDQYTKKSLLDELVELKILENFYKSKNVEIRQDPLARSTLDVLRYKFIADYTTWKEGYVLFCRYDRGFYDGYEKIQSSAEQLIASQKAYAETYCSQAKDRLINGASFADELQKVKDDPVIGSVAWQPDTMSFGKEFDRTHFKKEYLNFSFDLFDRIASTAIPLNMPTLLQANVESLQKDGVYAVVNVTAQNSSGITTNYRQWLDDQMKSMHVKIYPDRIKT